MVVSKKTKSNLSHDLKEPLTSIKGLTYILIENYRDNLNANILFILKDILDQSETLESIINDTLVNYKPKDLKYDILIVDDDEATNKVLVKYFNLRGYSSKSVKSGSKAMIELKHHIPKIILLDIILPKTNGYEICKMIKSNDNLRDVLIYYITAIPGNELEENMDETKADGYFLKPFNFPEFDILLNYLSKK